MDEIDLALVKLSMQLRSSQNSIFLGRDDAGDPLFASAEDSVVLLGRARSDQGTTGKSSGVISPSVACHPGLVIVTTVRSGYGEHPDVRDTTYRSRMALAEATGGRVYEWVLDDNYPTVGTRSWWSIVDGCRSWNAALDRARALAYSAIASDTSNVAYFRNNAMRLLAPILCYAASQAPPLTDDDVVWLIENGTWTQHSAEVDSNLPDDEDVDPASRFGIMERIAGHLAVALGENHPACSFLAQFFDETRTRLEDQQVIRAVILSEVLTLFSYDKADDLVEFRLADLFRGSSTVYISVTDGRSQIVRPLVSAFCSSLVSMWRSTPPAGRPASLLLALDEVTQVAPIEELPSLISSGGGDGIQCLLGFQDSSQAKAQWGQKGKELINGATYEVAFPGLKDVDYLQERRALLPEIPRQQRHVVLRGVPPHGPRFVSGAELIAERTLLEERIAGLNGWEAKAAGDICAREILAARAARGKDVRPSNKESLTDRLLDEIMTYTEVEIRSISGPALEMSELASGLPSSVLVISGRAAKYVSSVGWWRDPLWSVLLRPTRPDGY